MLQVPSYSTCDKTIDNKTDTVESCTVSNVDPRINDTECNDTRTDIFKDMMCNATKAGRVDVTYAGENGTLCAVNWTRNDSQVACKMLNATR